MPPSVAARLYAGAVEATPITTLERSPIAPVLRPLPPSSDDRTGGLTASAVIVILPQLSDSIPAEARIDRGVYRTWRTATASHPVRQFRSLGRWWDRSMIFGNNVPVVRHADVSESSPDVRSVLGTYGNVAVSYLGSLEARNDHAGIDRHRRRGRGTAAPRARAGGGREPRAAPRHGQGLAPARLRAVESRA